MKAIGLTATAAAGFVILALGWVLWDVFSHGVPTWSFLYFTSAPAQAGRAGGIAPVLVSTTLLLVICLMVALPLSFGCALFLSESRLGRSGVGRFVRASLDATAAVPSIVFGLFGNAVFAQYLGMGYSLWSGGLTLACMVLPLLIRSTESALRAVSDHQRMAAAALDLSLWTTVRHILLPAAAPGIVAGVVLGLGRASAETAALLFTAGYVMRMPSSLSDSGRSLSVHIYDLAMNVPGGDQRAYAAAATLVTILLAINLAAAAMGKRLQRNGARA
jgi:phosphate transport system permease protein